MTSTMTQHVEQSEDFTRAHVKSWLRVKDTLGTARAWAQHVELAVQMHSTLLSHVQMTVKQRKC